MSVEQQKRVLIIGAGVIAGDIIDYLKERKYSIRIIVRDAAKVDKFKDKAEVVVGNVTDKEMMRKAFDGVHTVISVIGSSVFPQPLLEQNEVIELAKEAGVKHFIPALFSPRLSIAPPLLGGILQTYLGAKEEGLRRVKESGMAWTGLFAGLFTETWLSPDFGFDIPNSTVRIPGLGKNQLPWLTYKDCAQYVAQSVENPLSINREFYLGTENFSYDQVIKIVENETKKKMQVTRLLEEDLIKHYHTLRDEEDKIEGLEKGVTGLKIILARAGPTDLKELQEAYPDFKTNKTIAQFVADKL